MVSGNPLTVTATNTGGLTANGVTVTDPLPTSAVFRWVSTTAGSCARTPTGKPKPKARIVTCNASSLGAADSVTITIAVTATRKGSLQATARVTAPAVTSDSDDTATGATTVLGD